MTRHHQHAHRLHDKPRQPPAALANPPPNTRLALIREQLAAMGAPDFRYRQIVSALSRSDAETFEEIHALPRTFRKELTERLGPRILPLAPVAVRSDAQVEKVLFESQPGIRFETVLSRYRAGWSSICVSSQAGCALGCTFCATGAVGLARNLAADEIYAQVLHPHWRRSGTAAPESVAFMGMGEALANPHLFGALDLLTGSGYGGMSPRRITVSTVGFAPNLLRLTQSHPQVTITLSVHSPFAEQRAGLIPLERRFPLVENLAVLDEHASAVRRKIYLAYLLIAGVNDTADHAHGLADLVAARSRPELFHVSVIRYNQAVGADPSFHAPATSHVNAFVAALRARGVHATRRRQFGSAIDAACGQLHARHPAGVPSDRTGAEAASTRPTDPRTLRTRTLQTTPAIPHGARRARALTRTLPSRPERTR